MKNTSTNKINEQAREWFTTMQSGSVTEHERLALQRWLSASPANQEAYDQYEEIWSSLGKLSATPEGAALRRSVANEEPEGFLSSFLASCGAIVERMFNPQLALAFATITLAVGVWFSFTNDDPSLVPVQYQTGLGEVRLIHLPDGSEVTLSAKSSISFAMNDAARSVDLLQGRVFFDISKDKGRPFGVRVNATLIRVVGTEFDVDKGQDRVKVSVAEGVVTVSSSSEAGTSQAEAVVLTAGQQVTHLEGGDFQVVNNVPVDSMGNWRHGRLVYQRARLEEVINEANRYFPGTIYLDPSLAELEVTAAFNTNQLESLPETLESFLPILVKREKNNHVSILPNESE